MRELSLLELVSAVACFAHPASTFAGLADMLGFLFLIVGIWWMVRPFLERPINPLWWMLAAGRADLVLGRAARFGASARRTRARRC